jgi:hypothetical protein
MGAAMTAANEDESEIRTMSKSQNKQELKKSEAKRANEDEHDENDAAQAEDSDEEEAPSAAKPRAQRPRADAHGHDAHGHDDAASESSEDEDPTWWAPHAVLGLLVIVGVLGFFGMFNEKLAFLRAKPVHQETAATEPATTAKPMQPSTGPTPPRPLPNQPEQARETFGAKHLLVMYKGSRRGPASITRSKEEAQARATEAAKKAKSGKAKFEDLVKEYSDEPGAGQRGGDLGNFPKGSMVPEFQAGLEKLKVGETSDVVESPFGFHVILRTK